jgi:hypothetical protein
MKQIEKTQENLFSSPAIFRIEKSSDHKNSTNIQGSSEILLWSFNNQCKEILYLES